MQIMEGISKFFCFSLQNFMFHHSNSFSNHSGCFKSVSNILVLLINGLDDICSYFHSM